jgi:hypothetical protein
MATSGDTTYELTRNQIIEAAMRKCGRLAKGQSADSTDLTNGTIALNSIIASFQKVHGMPVWARADHNITLVASQRDYTLASPFPIKIHAAYLETITGGAMRELQPIAYTDFRLLNTESTGTPVNYTYQPRINTGTLSIWPLPTSSDVTAHTLTITYQRPFEGFTAAGETPDFPQEWQNALIYELAVVLAPEFGVPLDDRKLLRAEAKDHLENVMLNEETESLFFQIDRTR